jgi:hypothetical protein
MPDAVEMGKLGPSRGVSSADETTCRALAGITRSSTISAPVTRISGLCIVASP